MGFETITDNKKKQEWKVLIEDVHGKLEQQHYSLIFTSFKNDGTYAKAKTKFPGIYFVFGQDSINRWVEIEFKPRTINGEKFQQVEKYNSVKNMFFSNSFGSSNLITWDDEDRANPMRRDSGKDLRIKMYVGKCNEVRWSDYMVEFINVFIPILNRSSN